MSAANAASGAAEAGSSTLRNIGKGLAAGGGVLGGLDLAGGNGFDQLGLAIAEVARQGGNVLAAVGDLVNRVTPDFLSDLIPQGAGEAGEAAGMLVPYALDVVPVVV